jgi:hypothetical protein
MNKRYLIVIGGLFSLLAVAACASAGPEVSAEELPPDAPAVSECPATASVFETPPDDPNADEFGSGPWFVNEDRTLWVLADPAWTIGSHKAIWIRPEGTQVEVSGRRLAPAGNGDSGAPSYSSPGGYLTGFEVGGLTFPARGCWEVNATAGESQLQFVIEIR